MSGRSPNPVTIIEISPSRDKQRFGFCLGFGVLDREPSIEFGMTADTISARGGVHQTDHPVGQPVHPFGTLTEAILAAPPASTVPSL